MTIATNASDVDQVIYRVYESVSVKCGLLTLLISK